YLRPSSDSNQVDAIRAALNLSQTIVEVLGNSMGITRLAKRDEDAENIIRLARNSALSTQSFFTNVTSSHLGGLSPEGSIKTISRSNEDVQVALESLAKAAEYLIPKNNQVDPTRMDLGDMVEHEMSNAARTIEEATARLQALMSKPKVDGLSAMELQVNASILESAMAMMQAIGHLIKCATISQQEIVAQGRGTSTNAAFYKKNNRWTEGLISAAKAVAMATTLLVETADGVISKTHSMEQLLVASNEVAAATAQLVAAARVKASFMSKAQDNLERASKAVTEASRALVRAVKAIMDREMKQREEEVDYQNMNAHEFKIKEMQQQVEILKLEKELTLARRRREMNSDIDQQDSFLSIEAVFSKVIGPIGLHPPTKSTLAASASPSVRKDHIALPKTRVKDQTLCFVGRVVRIDRAQACISNEKEEGAQTSTTRFGTDDLGLDSLAVETSRRLFQEQSQRQNSSEDRDQDYILWLSDTVEKVTQPRTVIVLDSDDDDVDDQDTDKKSGQANVGHSAELSTLEQPPRRFVVVLVNNTMIHSMETSAAGSRTVLKSKENLSRSPPDFLLNMRTQVKDALVLGSQDYGQEVKSRPPHHPCLIVPAIGIMGQTQVQIHKAFNPISRKRRSAAELSPRLIKRVSLGPIIKEPITQEETTDLATEEKRPDHKRPRSESVILLDDTEEDHQKNQKDAKVVQRPRLDSGPSISSSATLSLPFQWPQSFQQPSAKKEIDPLDLLMHDDEPIDSFDSGLQPLSIPSLNSQSTMVNEIPCLYFAELWSAHDHRLFNKTALPENSDKTMTRHVCWLARINVARIRAVCGECSNDYKGMYCTFGCGSRRWRLEIMIDFVASDGSAEMQCRIEGARAESSMWALLGLAKKPTSVHRERQQNTTLEMDSDEEEIRNYISQLCTSASMPRLDPIEERKNKILRTLARRGELSYRRTDSHPSSRPTGSMWPGTSAASGSTGMNDNSERARLEQKLWTDVCNAAAPTTTTTKSLMTSAGHNNSMVLTVSGPITTGSSGPKATMDRSMQLQRTSIRIGRVSSMTVTRPPMILQVVHVENITPLQESRLLLKSLGRELLRPEL
ncbi:sla2 Src-like adaptor 2, partial [Lunasporangiospora selenospora]